MLLSDFALDPNSPEQGYSNYLAPEQKGKPAIPASDQFALAMVTCWLLTDTTPALGALDRLRQRDYEAVAQVLERALADEPAKRYPSVDEFVVVWTFVIPALGMSDPYKLG